MDTAIDSSKTSVTSIATSTQGFGITKSTGDAAIGIQWWFSRLLPSLEPSAIQRRIQPNGPIIIGIATAVTNSTITIGGPGLAPLQDNSDGVSDWR